MVDEHDESTQELALETPEPVADDATTDANLPQEMANKVVAGRDPETGQFVKGWKGGGRPKGSKDKLNKQVINTLERIWASRGDEIIEHLAAEKPEVLAGLVARLIPQSLAAEAIEGEDKENNKQINDIRITLVTQQPELPAAAEQPRLVEGELLPPDAATTH